MITKENVIVLKGKSQYDILRVATDRVAEELSNRGYNVITFDLLEGESLQKLFNYINNNSIKMIFSFNGLLLDYKDNDGVKIFSYLKEPYVTFLVDHPLYQQDRLCISNKNLCVLTFDRQNVNFLKKYYPLIGKSEFSPFFGFEASTIIPYDKRKIEILFVGTYEDPKVLINNIADIEGVFQTVAINVVNILINNTSLSLEQGLRKYFSDICFDISDNEFYDLIHMMDPVDKYIRQYFRDKVLRCILDSGYKLSVYGNGWEVLKNDYKDNLIILNKGDSILKDGIELMADAKIVLSVMPWFKDCIQDRIISTMLCGSICLTDNSIYMNENLHDGEDIFFYSLNEIERLPEKIRNILSDDIKSAEIANKGRMLAYERYTCKNFVDNLLDVVPKNLFLNLRERLINKYKDTDDIEIKEILEFIKKYNLYVYNNNFLLDYENFSVETFYDDTVDMYYVFHNGKKMYYSKQYRTHEAVAQHYRFISIEQDIKSPHRYLDHDIKIEQGDVVIDAGVAEGNFALDAVDQASKLYLIECDQGWIEALKETFKPYMEKVIIIEKYLSNKNDKDNITIDYLTHENVNFIKMDIEGAEIDALEGAKNTIAKSNRLTCAICSYHKGGDETKIRNILIENGFDLSTTKGYMFFLHDENVLVDLELRRGIVRGVKNQ